MSEAVAHSYLYQAALAWPLISPVAHRLKIMRLGRRVPGVLDPPTESLMADFLEWLRPRCRGISLEALRVLAEGVWFSNQRNETCLSDLLARHVRRWLAPSGSRVMVRNDEHHAQYLEELRWFTLLLPADLGIAALYAAECPADPPSDRLSLLNSHLSRILHDKPVAETHLHGGAAFSFGTLWTGVIGHLAANPMFLSSLPRDSECPWGNAHRFATMLVAAAITRMILGAFLWSLEVLGERSTFDSWLPGYLDKISTNAQAFRPQALAAACQRALTVVTTGETKDVPIAELSLVFRRLAGPRAKLPASLENLAALDPLSTWLGVGHEPWPESRFATRAIRYSLRRDDPAFIQLFWQYERIRNQMHRFLVQEPGTAGLGWFQRHYERIAPFRAPLRRLRFESAIFVESKDITLQAIEVRCGFPTSAQEVGHDVRALKRATRNAPNLEFGLVYHFCKQEWLGLGRLRKRHSDPRQLAHGCRFGAWAYRARVEALAVERALAIDPELLLVLRGFDVASMELAIPTWVCLPGIFRVRQASEKAAYALAQRKPRVQVDPCRMTCHAGEEYLRLVQGLRRVHELVEFGAIRAGDRLGHATSVGENTARWAERHTRVMQPREERLDDLLWELDRYRQGDLPIDPSRLEMVRHEAREHAQFIYASPVDIDDLCAARKLRHDVGFLDRLEYPFLRKLNSRSTPVVELTIAYLVDPDIHDRGVEPVIIDVSALELKMLVLVQRWLRSRIATLGITIETNPSSNMLIADLASVDQHPALRLRPLEQHGEHLPLLSINADDPVTFATCVSDELAYIHAALLRKHVDSATALEWIAQRCADGFGSRFTLRRACFEQS